MLYSKIIFSLLISPSLFFAGVLDHVKKAEGKSLNHAMEGIDFIYMINLDKRPEKFLQASSQLTSYGIHPYRFSAVNGWELSLEVINDVGLRYKPGMNSLFATSYPLEGEGLPSHGFMREDGGAYFVHCMAYGTIGCALSHISVLKDAWDSGYETIWVLEDDVVALKDPREISTLIEKLDALVGKENWDVFFTDRDYRSSSGGYVVAYGAAKRPDMDCSYEERYSEKYTVNTVISDDFCKIGARFGTHSMVIRRSGIKKLLDFAEAHQIYLPYDLDNYLAPGINRYGLCYDLVTNMLHSLSDNGKPGYKTVDP